MITVHLLARLFLGLLVLQIGIATDALAWWKQPPQHLQQLADAAAQKHGLDKHLFRALIHQESTWRPRVVSSAGAVGLTQLIPSTARGICGLARHKLKEPEPNLDCGARYLAQQIRRFGEVKLALCAFNAGPTKVAKYGRCPNYRQTRAYVKKIMHHWAAQKTATVKAQVAASLQQTYVKKTLKVLKYLSQSNSLF